MSEPYQIDVLDPESLIEIVDKLQDTLDEYSVQEVVAACLAVCFIVQNDEIPPEALQDGIKSISTQIALYLDSLQLQELPPNKVN